MRLDKAQSENDKIYFDKVPATVQDPEGKMMAKSEPLPDAGTCVGTDRFAHLVPAVVHKAALAYAATRQDMVNELIGRFQVSPLASAPMSRVLTSGMPRAPNLHAARGRGRPR